MNEEIQKILHEHDADVKTGFLPPQEPLQRLPAEYDAWESILDRLPELLQQKKLRECVDSMPLLDATHLNGNVRFLHSPSLHFFLFFSATFCLRDLKTVAATLPFTILDPASDMSFSH
jgi:hypothetical protein